MRNGGAGTGPSKREHALVADLPERLFVQSAAPHVERPASLHSRETFTTRYGAQRSPDI